MDGKRREPGPRGFYSDSGHGGGSAEDVSRASGAFEVPTQGYGAQYSAGERRVQTQGYAVPEGQFEYDGGYYGRMEQGDGGLYGRR